MNVNFAVKQFFLQDNQFKYIKVTLKVVRIRSPDCFPLLSLFQAFFQKSSSFNFEQ